MICLLCLLIPASAASVVDYWPDEPIDDSLAGADEEAVSAVPMPLAAISPTYSVGTTNINLFSGVVHKLPYGVHYVYWRESQYVYTIAYGRALELSGSVFKGSDITLVSYNTYTGGSSQSTWTRSMQGSFTLSVGNYLVWSDLGDYPQLVERRTGDYAQTCCVILCSFALYYLFHHLWADIRQRYLDG